MTKNAKVWKAKMGHCPMCGGLCSERIPTPCSLCSRKNPAAADKWMKEHPSTMYADPLPRAYR